MLIYFWDNFWKINSKDKNKYKNWYTKIPIESYILSYKKFNIALVEAKQD